MADQPGFNQIFESALYSVSVGPGAQPGPGWVGFIYTAGKDYPARLDFKSSFNNGYYVFAPTAPPVTDTDSAKRFVATIQEWLNQNFGNGAPKLFSGSACVWLLNAKDPVCGPAITFFPGISSTLTANNFNLQMGQLTLSITQQVIVNVNDQGLRFRETNEAHISFKVPTGNNAPTIDTEDTDVILPFIGNYAGALTMQGAISRAGNPGVIAYFETGFHYLYAVPDEEDQCQIYPVICSGGSLSALPYSGSVDPIDPLNSVEPLSNPAVGRYRTLFAFTSKTPIESWYRDDSGNPVALVPLNGINSDGEPMPYCGALVLQSRQAAGARLDSVYMTLAGDFALAPEVVSGANLMLLPGLFGTERFRLSSYASGSSFDRLRFQPDGSAYAPVFPFPDSKLDNPDSSRPKPRLTSRYLTSWGAILNGPQGQSAYLAQPEGNPLYAPSSGAAKGDVTLLLQPLDTPSAIPQPAPPDPPFLLPFVPYAGLSMAKRSFPAPEVGSFESQVLSFERKRLLDVVSTQHIAAMKLAQRSGAITVAPTVRQATTPQGLYAEVTVPDPSSGNFESSYEKVVLAKSIPEQPATGAVDFGFTHLHAKLQSLFQTNQLMSVIVNPEFLGMPNPFDEYGTVPELGAPAFNRDVVIADWCMTAAVGDSLNSTAYNNILILKYCDGALAERVKNPNKWVGVDDFSIAGHGDKSIALAGLSSFLQNYLKTGIDNAAKGNKLYTHFARIAQDPDWNGVLVLRASVDPSGFPDEIKGLVAGIDLTMFEAHHFGVTASRVTLENGVLSMKEPSSLFGLIDYELPAYRQNVASNAPADMPLPLPTEPGSDFGFTVLQLQTLFENGFMTDFRSRVQLSVNTLFGSRVTVASQGTTQLPAQAVVLQGRYIKQGGIPTYILEQDDLTLFSLSSNALPTVAFRRIQFNTMSNSDDNTLLSRFLVWGDFVFPVMNDSNEQEVDLLSFGPAKDVSVGGNNVNPPGLAFSDFEISMRSSLSCPNAVTFGFDIGRLALDQGSSQPREHSLFTDLALQVDGFISGSEEKRPIDYGYLPISVSPKIKAISGEWYGIEYKVNMGTPGALASSAGFTSRILVAWSPETVANDAASAVFVGLQLPGAKPGAKLLSIQGVLKLSIASLTLTRETVGIDKAFVLRLNNLGLSFLGLLKLPPGANINFFLFGDPSGTGSLGWYAAYQATDKEQVTLSDVGPLPALPGESGKELVP